MEDFTLKTAENVPLRYDIATVGSRLPAIFLDYFIILMISFGFLVAAELSQSLGEVFSAYFIALFYVVVGTSSWAYFVISEMVFNGGSIGKRALGLKVIKEDGSPIDLVDSLTRNFIRFVDIFPGTYLVGFVAMMLNDKSKRLGDFAAGTVVVRVHSVQLDRLFFEETLYDNVVKNSPGLSLITPEEYQLMRDFITQRYRLPAYKSSIIAEKLATRMAEKLQVEQPQNFEDRLQFIKSCVKYYE